MNHPNIAYAENVAIADEVNNMSVANAAISAEKRERLALIEEAIRSEEHYKQTGLHITWEECKAWLRTWGTPDEKEAPECHT